MEKSFFLLYLYVKCENLYNFISLLSAYEPTMVYPNYTNLAVSSINIIVIFNNNNLQVFIHNPFTSGLPASGGRRITGDSSAVPDLYYLNIGQQVLYNYRFLFLYMGILHDPYMGISQIPYYMGILNPYMAR